MDMCWVSICFEYFVEKGFGIYDLKRKVIILDKCFKENGEQMSFGFNFYEKICNMY